MKTYNLVDLKTKEIYGRIMLENGSKLIKINITEDYLKVVRQIINETKEAGGFNVKISDSWEISDSTREFWLTLKQNLFRYLNTVVESTE